MSKASAEFDPPSRFCWTRLPTNLLFAAAVNAVELLRRLAASATERLSFRPLLGCSFWLRLTVVDGEFVVFLIVQVKVRHSRPLAFKVVGSAQHTLIPVIHPIQKSSFTNGSFSYDGGECR